MKRRYYSLEESNALLPLITPIAQRLVQLHACLRATLGRLSLGGVDLGQVVLAGLEEPPTGTDQDSLIGQAQMLYECVLDEIDKVEQLGGEVKDLEIGLIDFWARLDGETDVLLCWRLGEQRIDHFHAPDGGYATRESVYGRSFAQAPAALSILG